MTRQRDPTAAERLTTLSAAGGIVTTNGERLAVDGPEDAQALWDAQLDALSRHKRELIRILSAEAAAAAPPPPPPESTSPPLPRGPVVAGVAVMTGRFSG